MFRSLLVRLLLNFVVDSPERLGGWALTFLDWAKKKAAESSTAIDDWAVEQARAFVLSADWERFVVWLREWLSTSNASPCASDLSAIDETALMDDVAYELRVAGWESIIPLILPLIQTILEMWRKRRDRIDPPKPPVNV